VPVCNVAYFTTTKRIYYCDENRQAYKLGLTRR